MGQSHYKIPERTGEIPRVISGGSQLLVECPGPLGLVKGKLPENWGRGLDKQACRTLLYNYLPLYEGQSKAESTAAFLLRTEVLGLNAWLASIHVPQITPHCTCGWPTQTVRHVLLFCNHRTARDQLLARAGTSDITQMLSTSRGLHAAA